MTKRVVKLIQEAGDKIVCEAEVNSVGGHAGMILFKHDGHKEVLGKTDPTFVSAEEAVKVMERTVKTLRSSKPEKVVKEKPSSKKKRGEK